MLKSIDLRIRLGPLLLCVPAYYVEWHMRETRLAEASNTTHSFVHCAWQSIGLKPH